MRASIDIGTNTALLLVAQVNDGALEVVREEQRVPRLGQGVDETGKLSQEAMERVIDALKEYLETLNQCYSSVENIRLLATSAVRDAHNREAFVDLVREQTGLEVEILSGFEEARYTYLGAQSVLEDGLSRQNVVIDIGGGSTEIAAGSSQNMRDRYSFDMGCVRFTERFLRDDPPTKKQIEACRRAVQDGLEKYEFNFVDKSSLIGVAGTVTSLAFINKQLIEFKSKAIDNHRLSKSVIGDYIQQFRNWPSQKLLDRYPEVMEGRADIFLAGLLILDEFMSKYGFSELITSTGGIRHGALLEVSE